MKLKINNKHIVDFLTAGMPHPNCIQPPTPSAQAHQHAMPLLLIMPFPSLLLPQKPATLTIILNSRLRIKEN